MGLRQFVRMLCGSLYDVIIVVIEKYLMAAISTGRSNSMIETVAQNEASCVASPVLLMCGSITVVVMTYIHTCSSPEVCCLI